MYQLKDCKTINFAVWPTKKAIFDRGNVSLKNTSSKIDPRDFRREIIPFPLRFAKYLSFCADVNSKTLLVSEGLKNLVTSIKEQIYFEFQASKAENERKVVIHPGIYLFFTSSDAPFYLQNDRRTEVSVIFVYRSCDHELYFDRNCCKNLPEVQGLKVHRISGCWWDWWHLVRKFEVNLSKCAWQIIAAFFCNTCLSNNIDYY